MQDLLDDFDGSPISTTPVLMQPVKLPISNGYASLTSPGETTTDADLTDTEKTDGMGDLGWVVADEYSYANSTFLVVNENGCMEDTSFAETTDYDTDCIGNWGHGETCCFWN